ncbi:MAG: type II toxin-antitoxin system RelE/ParE family toxin [Metallibacterium sp.]
MATVEVRQYQTADGRSPFAEWLADLRDRHALQAIMARIVRMQAGNRGDWKALGTGPGYRVYCGQDGAALVLLLCAGDKRTQTKDIEHARDYWKDYQGRR